MTTIKWSTFAFALLVAARIATAQNAPDGSSSADVERVMRKYEAALGGRPLLLSIKTREIHGTFEYKGVEQHATGQLEMKWRAPTLLVEQLRGPMGIITKGFDGTHSWGSHPQAGARQLSPAEIDEMVLEGVLYQPLGVRHWYGELSYEGRANIGGRNTEVLAAARHGGRTDRFYFDIVSGLPVRLDVWEEGPEAVRQPGEFYLAHYQLDDYRIVDGVAVPFTVRRERPNSTMVFRFAEVRQNVPLSDSIFKGPARVLRNTDQVSDPSVLPRMSGLHYRAVRNRPASGLQPVQAYPSFRPASSRAQSPHCGTTAWGPSGCDRRARRDRGPHGSR